MKPTNALGTMELPPPAGLAILDINYHYLFPCSPIVFLEDSMGLFKPHPPALNSDT